VVNCCSLIDRHLWVFPLADGAIFMSRDGKARRFPAPGGPDLKSEDPPSQESNEERMAT
jgi:hypothetical protein